MRGSPIHGSTLLIKVESNLMNELFSFTIILDISSQNVNVFNLGEVTIVR